MLDGARRHHREEKRTLTDERPTKKEETSTETVTEAGGKGIKPSGTRAIELGHDDPVGGMVESQCDHPAVSP
jgi:hypothetical protein